MLALNVLSLVNLRKNPSSLSYEEKLTKSPRWLSNLYGILLEKG
jgi:hypothetical protein